MEINILGQRMRIEIIIICIIIGWFICVNVFCSCSGGVKEGFNSALDITGAALGYSMGDGVKNSWEHVRENIHQTSGISSLEGNLGGPVPLPDGELYMFKDNKSDPNCCPGVYSSSTGCVCASPEQMNYLNKRGGNRTMGYGEF